MKVSVIMPAYNAEKTIKKAVQSVLNQTYSDLELIIIDDCSTDGTLNICKTLAKKDERIRVYKNSANGGAANARNAGVNISRGEWIAFLDGDDTWHKNKLQKQLSFAKNAGAEITYTACAFKQEGGGKIDFILRANRELNYKELCRRNLMTCSSVMLKRELALQNEFPDGDLHEDYAAWLTLLRGGKIAAGLDEALVTYTVSKTSRSGNLVKSGLMVYRTYRHIGINALTAFCMTARYSIHSLKKRGSIKKGVGQI